MPAKSNKGSNTNDISLGFRERPDQPQRLRQINQRNAAIASERQMLLEAQLTSATAGIALQQRESEAKRGIPINNWSFEMAVEDAANAAALVRAAQGRRGGESKKTDALQEIILGIVRRLPGITVSQLRSELKKLEGGDVIADIDDDRDNPLPSITFQKRNRTMADAPLSGLKDRLSRAKKIVQKEIADSS